MFLLGQGFAAEEKDDASMRSIPIGYCSSQRRYVYSWTADVRVSMKGVVCSSTCCTAILALHACMVG